MAATTHPYISGPGNVTQMISHLRKSFPQTVTSDTVKKLGLAPNNESYVINALQFIGVIDAEGKRTSAGTKVFSSHKDEDFAKNFSDLIKSSYKDLFDLYSEGAWELSSDELITFFRQTDNTSSAIGSRQAGLFKVFAGQSGYGDIPAPKVSNNKKSKPNGGEKKPPTLSKVAHRPNIQNPMQNSKENQNPAGKDFGLTVRIEINLPADGTKETYDNIFKSIKENLLNG